MLARQQQDVHRQRCRGSKERLCLVVVGLLGGHVWAAYAPQNPHCHLRREQGGKFVLCLTESYEGAPQFLVSVCSFCALYYEVVYEGRDF